MFVFLHNNDDNSYNDNSNNNRSERRNSRFFTIFSLCRKLSPTCTVTGLPFSRSFADFREHEVSESAKKKTPNPRKIIRPNLFLKRQLKLTQTASKLQPRADNRILHLVFALRYEISRDQPVIVFWVKMPRSDFVRRHEAAFRDFHIFLVGALGKWPGRNWVQITRST